MNEATAICPGCLHRVSIVELSVETGTCDHCRDMKARTGSVDGDGQLLGADGGVHLDLRDFDGGGDLVSCDEV